MKINQLKKILFKEKTSVKEVLKKFEETINLTDKRGFGIILNSSNKCLGIITEGDIRRFIIKGGDLNKKAILI